MRKLVAQLEEAVRSEDDTVRHWPSDSHVPDVTDAVPKPKKKKKKKPILWVTDRIGI